MTNAIAPDTRSNHTDDTAWCIYSPDLDVFDNDHEVVLIADIPGATADQIQIRLEDSVLSIYAETPNTDGGCRTTYRRQVKLAVPVDPDKIEAEAKHGELTLRLAKASSHRPRRVEVRAG